MTDTVTMQRSVVEQALDALQDANTMMEHRQDVKLRHSAMADLRAALEQPQQVEQEPVAWMDAETRVLYDHDTSEVDQHHGFKPTVPLYTHPQPQRQPLTDAQINDHRLALPYDGEDLPDPWDFKQGVRAAERAHGIGGEA